MGGASNESKRISYSISLNGDAIVKPKQTGTFGRGIRNEHIMSNTNAILI